jgi:lipopolysaccharide export system permease protein
MRILDRYVARWVIGGSALALAVLLSLFTVFTLLDELGDVGRGDYGLLQVAQYLALSTPRRTYELVPVAALLGTLLGLGVLASHSELTVIRVSGVSTRRLALSVAQAAAVPALAGVLLGELAVPGTEALAEGVRTAAMASHQALKTRRGFWARDGRRFVNVQHVLPSREMEGVYLYEFDEAGRLQRTVRADRARPEGDAWRLEGLVVSEIGGDRVVARWLTSERWESPLAPDLVGLAVLRPERASSLELARYTRFLAANGQDPAPYAFALWSKLTAPVTTVALTLLVVPFLLGPLRHVGLGPRTLVGALRGVGFHIANQTSTHLGLVYGLPPVLGAAAPTLVVLGVGLWLLRRAG